MKAEIVQQRSLLEVAELDAELSRIEHRAKHLSENQQLEAVQAKHRDANDRLASLQIALDDLDAQVAKFESEIDAVRQREDRDRSLLASGSIDAKQLTDLQHELETLERRQSSLEDSLLEVMERREELEGDQAHELAKIDELQNELSEAQTASTTHAPRSISCATNVSRGATNSFRSSMWISLRCTSASGPAAVRVRGRCRVGAAEHADRDRPR